VFVSSCVFVGGGGSFAWLFEWVYRVCLICTGECIFSDGEVDMFYFVSPF
jgi:hypothetical protein